VYFFMKLFKKTLTGTAVLMFATTFSSASIADSYDSEKRGFKNRTTVVQLIGTDIVEERMVPDLDGDGVDDLARCFDMAVLNVRTGAQIGTGADCIANVTPVDGGLQIDATYYLYLNRGSIIIRGRNTAQPLLRETVTISDGAPYSHSVAASGDWNAKLGGTGKYRSGEARLRVSGLMNIDNVNGTAEDTAFLDLILVIEHD
jgi:hypothetical protein